MKRKRPSLKRPVLYVISGLLHFVFMFFGYANEFWGLSIDRMQELYSVYGSIRFGDTAIASYICGMAEQCGHAGEFTFFATLSIVFVLVSTVLAAVVIIHGIFGLIKGLAHVDMTPTLRDAAFDSRASRLAIAYHISVWLSVAFLLFACLLNLYNIGGKTYCVLPGLGMILLFLAAVVECILLCVFNKKAAARRQAEEADMETPECPSCRAHVTPGTLFCPVCGTRINVPVPATKDAEAEPTEEVLPEPEVIPFPYSKYFGLFYRAMKEIREGAERKKISQRTVSVLTVLCVILMIFSFVSQVVGIVVMIPEVHTSTPMDNDISILYNDRDNNTQILTNGYILEETIPGSVSETTYSLDGKTALMLSYSNNKFALHLCYGTTIRKIAAMSYTNQALSADGTSVAYVDENQQLVLYRVISGQTVTVAGKPHGDFSLSPDGDSLLYCIAEEDTETLYAYIGGKTVKITNRASPIAISDGGKFIYYHSWDDNTVSVRKQNGETVTLCEPSDGSKNLVCYLNRDHTEIIFSLANNVYYTCKGGPAVKLSGKGIKAMGDFAYWCRTSGDTLPIDSFVGQYFTDRESKLYYIGNNVVFVIEKGVEAFSVSTTGDVAYYKTCGGDLYRIESRDAARGNEKQIKMASNVASYILSPNGQHCYYLDTENQLWHATKDGKPRFVAANVLGATVNRDGYGFFIIQNPETKKLDLYATKQTGKVYLIRQNVAVVTATYNRCYYFVASDTEGLYTTYEIYSAAHGLNFKEVMILAYAE